MNGTPLKYQISDCPVWVLAIVLFVHGIHGDKDLAAEEPLQRQGMGEPGALESLAIENAGGAGRLALIGRDAEALQHAHVEIAQRRRAFRIEGEVLAVLETAPGEEDG